MPRPTLRQILAYARTDLTPPPAAPPSPYEIAMRMGAALLSSGRFGDDFGAPMQHGWACVIPYYQGQAFYETQGQMLFDMSRHASEPEGEMDPGEARAYVTGGETGGIGETRQGGNGAAQSRGVFVAPDAVLGWGGGQLGAVEAASAEPDAMRERQENISRCYAEVREASEAFAAATLAAKSNSTPETAAARRKAQKRYRAAVAAQSAAHAPL